MSRGVDEQEIFLEQSDYQDFIELLRTAKARSSCRIYAYCLMPTHFHLLMEIAAAPLYRMMQWLLSCHSRRFNWKHNRKGHLFGDRYKSLHCTDNSYFLTLLRYIHLNPVRAGLAALPEQWEWSGHAELLGALEPNLIDAGFPLGIFDRDASLARRLYKEFLSDLESCTRSLDPFESISESLPPHHPHDEPPVTSTGTACRLLELARQVSRETGTSLDSLRGQASTATLVRARRSLAAQAVAQGIMPSHLAKFLNRSRSSISRALRPNNATKERNKRNL